MAKKPISIRIDADVLATADKIAETFGMTRTGVLEAGVKLLDKSVRDGRLKPKGKT